VARGLLNRSEEISGGKNFRAQFKDHEPTRKNNMVAPLLAIGAVAAGQSIADKFSTTCSSAVSGIKNGVSNLSFSKVLQSQATSATDSNPYSGKDINELSSTSSKLGQDLASSDEIKAFIGNDKTYKVRAQGDDYIVERNDGTIWRINSDSAAYTKAHELCQCRTALEQANGATNVDAGKTWTVSLPS
jgi:aconitase B